MIKSKNNLPERLFMTALLKHTAIALVILVPLALYSSFATARTAVDNRNLSLTSSSGYTANAVEVASSPTAVPNLDLQKYAGRWYEIARFPMYFQRQCASDVTATYTPKQDAEGEVAFIDVINQCQKADKTVISADGVAVPSQEKANMTRSGKVSSDASGTVNVRGNASFNGDEVAGKLKVTFLPTWLRWLPVGRADYWVLAVDEGYQHALVGTPDHKYLWMLSRTPSLNQNTFNQFKTLAMQQGYDINRLQITAHNGVSQTIVSTAQR